MIGKMNVTLQDVQSVAYLSYFAYRIWYGVLFPSTPFGSCTEFLIALVWHLIQFIWIWYGLSMKAVTLLKEILIFRRVAPFSPFREDLNYEAELNRIRNRPKLAGRLEEVRTDHVGTLFRHKPTGTRRPAVLDRFNGIIALEEDDMYVDVGGATTFHHLTQYLLPKGLSVPVVPGFTSITLAGAISGIGIDSSGLHWGLPHDSVLEVDVLTADGSVIEGVGPNSSDPELRELWYALPNSYGSLVYILRVRMRVVQVQPWVSLKVQKMSSIRETLERIEVLQTENADAEDEDAEAEAEADFCEAVILPGSVADSAGDIYLLEASFCSDSDMYRDIDGDTIKSYPSDGVFYKEIPHLQGRSLKMSTYDYYWRWDGDMFWGVGSLGFLANTNSLLNQYFRRYTGRTFLNSGFLRRLQRMIKDFGGWYRSIFTVTNSNRGTSAKTLRVVQDLGLPMNPETVQRFLKKVDHRTGILPIWLCPFRSSLDADKYTLWPLQSSHNYIDVGIFGRVKEEHAALSSEVNPNFTRELECSLFNLGGTKCFYSDNYLNEQEFNTRFNGGDWDRLKYRWDPDGVFKDLRAEVTTTET